MNILTGVYAQDKGQIFINNQQVQFKNPGDALKAGNSFIGPAIIEETGATSVVGPGDKVTVDERMNLVVKIANHETGKMEALEEN